MLEEPQGGLDLEFGARLPVLTEHIDTLHGYISGYHFSGDDTEDVTGWRTRLDADVTPWLQAGARLQRDEERGSQGFLEVTLRFPTNAKASYRKHGLRARLDESPERDIDIVSGSVETAGAVAQPVMNVVTGAEQRVLHVNNQAAGGGNGTIENPYNTLAGAQAAMQAGDVVYVHAGDGTTTGQDNGMVIAANDIQLIGSGTNFTFDANRMSANRNLSGRVIASATTAPVITNTQVNGDGIVISADDVVISGITVDGANRDGIVIEASGGGASAQNVLVDDMTSINNRHGLVIHADNGGAASASVQNSSFTNNDQHGVVVLDETAGIFEVDLGGGALNSEGHNSITSNTFEDLAVDYDGQTLSAMNNWFGATPNIYRGTPFNENLLSHWLLDDNTGTSASDRVATNTANFVNNPAWVTTGHHNGALQFVRADADYIDGGDIANSDTGSQFTVSYWINADTLPATASHISKWEEVNTTMDNSWGIRASNADGTELFAFISEPVDTGNNYFYTSDADLTTGTWTMITMVYDGNGATNADRLKMYKNGTLLNGTFGGTIPATLHASSAPVVFGRQLTNAAAFATYYDGQADDIRIYNRAFTGAEIAELYNMSSVSTADTSGALSGPP